MKNTLSGNYSIFHIENKHTSEIEGMQWEKKAWWIKK